jgi:plasmid stabilization system protein ParE
VNPLPVTITARARADLKDISDWYEAIRPELALRFRDDVDLVIEAIGERPLSFPEVEEGVSGAVPDLPLQTVLCRRARRSACASRLPREP